MRSQERRGSSLGQTRLEPCFSFVPQACWDTQAAAAYREHRSVSPLALAPAGSPWPTAVSSSPLNPPPADEPFHLCSLSCHGAQSNSSSLVGGRAFTVNNRCGKTPPQQIPPRSSCEMAASPRRVTASVRGPRGGGAAVCHGNRHLDSDLDRDPPSSALLVEDVAANQPSRLISLLLSAEETEAGRAGRRCPAAAPRPGEGLDPGPAAPPSGPAGDAAADRPALRH
ncbi:unnamed protein product [Merluccius merluccius]